MLRTRRALSCNPDYDSFFIYYRVSGPGESVVNPYATVFLISTRMVILLLISPSVFLRAPFMFVTSCTTFVETGESCRKNLLSRTRTYRVSRGKEAGQLRVARGDEDPSQLLIVNGSTLKSRSTCVSPCSYPVEKWL